MPKGELTYFCPTVYTRIMFMEVLWRHTKLIYWCLKILWLFWILGSDVTALAIVLGLFWIIRLDVISIAISFMEANGRTRQFGYQLYTFLRHQDNSECISALSTYLATTFICYYVFRPQLFIPDPLPSPSPPHPLLYDELVGRDYLKQWLR